MVLGDAFAAPSPGSNLAATINAHHGLGSVISSVLMKLDLPPAEEDPRRVLAVFAWLNT